ncbi:MAG: FkbM family methyltransferase [Myxococcota bacterium]
MSGKARRHTILRSPYFFRQLGLSRGLQTIGRFLAEPEELLEVPVPGSAGHVLVRGASSDRRCYSQVFMQQEYAIDYGFEPEVIIDGGANVGFAAVYFAERFPGARIVSVEPEESNYALLERNVAPYANVTPVRGAIWWKKETLCFRDPNAAKWSFEVEAGDDAQAGDVAIEAFTVPELLAMVGADEAGLLKLDIEGAELGLLQHADAWKPQVRAMVIELHEYKQAGIDAAFEAVAQGALSRRRVGENHYVRFR